jgi:hypothetical protein
LSGVWISAAMMRGNDGMGAQVWLRVMSLRQTNDLMKQGLVPATNKIEHL